MSDGFSRREFIYAGLFAGIAAPGILPGRAWAGFSQGDQVSERGYAVLARYVEALFGAGHNLGNLGGEQAYAILALNRSASEVQQANLKLTDFLDPFVKSQYWIASSPADLHLYWQQTSLLKLVLDDDLAARLSSRNHQLIKELLFNFLEGFSDEYIRNGYGSSDPARATDIHGSDNHDIIRHGFFLLGSQVLATDQRFARRPLPGGNTPLTLLGIFAHELPIVLRRRATTGLIAEIASPTYVGVYLQTLFVIADHSSDPTIRSITSNFLDLFFADAAQETLAGVRGGARSRAYKTSAAYDGREDIFTLPLFVLTGLPQAGPLYPLRTGYIPPRDAFCVLTTRYRLQAPILSLFKSRIEMGRFQYDSRRPSTGSQTEVAVRGDQYPLYHPDSVPRFVRSSFVTPYYVLGWFTIDESLQALKVHDQNEEMGVITSTPNGRIAITGTPTNSDRRTSYSDLQAVGSSATVLVRRGIHAEGKLPVRLFFSADMVMRQVSTWLVCISGDGNSWFGLRSVSLNSGHIVSVPLEHSNWGGDIPGGPVPGTFYVLPADATLVVEAGSRDEGTLETFVSGISHADGLSVADSNDGIAYQPFRGSRMLTLYQSSKIPRIGDLPVTLPLSLTYSSPYLQSTTKGDAIVAKAPGGSSVKMAF